MSFAILVFSTLLGHVIAQASPQLCNGLYCIFGQAQCVNNTCVCDDPPYTYGDGYFNCYKKSQVRAEILNDPTLNTIGNETSAYTRPCRDLVTHLRLELKELVGKSSNIGYCYAQVHTFQTRYRGKFYVAGYEVALKLEYTNGTIKELSSLVYGSLGNVQLFGTDNAFLPDGPYGNDNIDYLDAANNVKVLRYYDADNGQYVFEVDACGLRITLVPYDTALGVGQPRVPGLSVAINCIHHPRYLDNDRSIGLAPKNAGGYSLQDLQNLYPGTTEQQALVAFAFTRNVAQTSYVSDECPLVTNSLNSCDALELAEALNKCYWIFEATRFVNCISGAGSSSTVVLNFFRLCVDHFCDGVDTCSSIQAIVGTCTNPQGPQLTNLLIEICSV